MYSICHYYKTKHDKNYTKRIRSRYRYKNLKIIFLYLLAENFRRNNYEQGNDNITTLAITVKIAKSFSFCFPITGKLPKK